MKILFFYKFEFEEPIGIMALSAFLKQNNHETYFIDIAFDQNYFEEVQKIKPDIIAYSITTGKHIFYQKINIDLKKELEFLSVFGGPHATFSPEMVMEEGVDVVCRGEGEYPILELVEALKSEKDHTGIKNLWLKYNGQMYRNEIRNRIENLDSLPFIDRALVNKYQAYRKLGRRYMLSGRGCPFKCSYCFNHAYNKLFKGKGKIIQKRSVENVISELKTVKESCTLKSFHFVDDIFTTNEQWCVEFCERYKKEIKIPFYAYTRVNLVTEKIIKSLKEANCYLVAYAIESGNEHMRNVVLKRNNSEKQIIKAADICRKYKINTFVQNMIALPEESIKMAFETIKLNIKCKPGYAWCSIFQPYPGTDLYLYCKEKGYFNNKDFEETFEKKSLLKRSNNMEFENLRHLFSLAVSFPYSIPLIKVLIKFPLTKLYFYLGNVYRAWCYFFKIKLIPLSDIPTILKRY